MYNLSVVMMTSYGSGICVVKEEYNIGGLQKSQMKVSKWALQKKKIVFPQTLFQFISVNINLTLLIENRYKCKNTIKMEYTGR